MLQGIGIDIEPIHKIDRLLRRYDDVTLRLVFTADELAQCRSAAAPALYLALCFCAKEAMCKALGTSMATIDWNEIESTSRGGQIILTLYGKAFQQATNLQVTQWQARWTIWNGHVTVVVVLFSLPLDGPQKDSEI